MSAPNPMPRPGGAKFVEPRFKDAGAFEKPTRKRVNPVSAAKRKKRAEAELAGVFEDVICRSHGVCELLGDRPATEMHHRRRAGRVDSVENLLHLSSFAHHQMIHANPAWARRHGLLLGAGDHSDVLVVSCPLSCEADHRTPNTRTCSGTMGPQNLGGPGAGETAPDLDSTCKEELT